MARCTKEQALETRSRILDAAENVFHAKGVSRTSLADVATAAGVTRGAIYWHFANKGDLFAAMGDRIRLPMDAMLDPANVEQGCDPLEQLRATCVFALRDAVQNPHSRKVLDIMFHKCELVDSTDPILMRQREAFLSGMATIERILGNAISKGQLPPQFDIRVGSIFLHAAISGLLENWLFQPERFDLAQDAENLVAACIETLRCAPSLRARSGG